MSQPQPDPIRTSRTVVTDYEDVERRGRRGLGGAWWLALAGIPLLLALLGSVVSRGGVESDLTAAAQKALSAAGVSGATVKFDGRDATVTLPAGVDAAKALDVVRGVDGVRVADAAGTAAGGNAAAPSTNAAPAPSTPSAAAPAAPASFSIAHAGSTITLTGTVPDEATHQAILAAAKASAGGASIVDHLTVASGSALPSGLTAAGIGSALAALPDGAQLKAEGTTVTLTGEVASDAVKSAAATAAASSFPGASIVNNLTVKAPALPAACATLGQTITDALNAHPLTFGVDSSALNPDQVAALNTLGATMKGCVGVPGGPTAVAVAGHTEAGGVNDPLSIARAEAVKAVLVSAGVPAAAITTSGVGAVDQAAPNTSDAGRAANRRVTISVK